MPYMWQRIQKKYNLQRHFKGLIHWEKKVECPICNKKFAERYDMEEHKKGFYLKIRPFTCEKCGKGFTKKHKRDKHALRCTEDCLMLLYQYAILNSLFHSKCNANGNNKPESLYVSLFVVII